MGWLKRNLIFLLDQLRLVSGDEPQVVAVINVDAYLSQNWPVTLRLQE